MDVGWVDFCVVDCPLGGGDCTGGAGCVFWVLVGVDCLGGGVDCCGGATFDDDVVDEVVGGLDGVDCVVEEGGSVTA